MVCDVVEMASGVGLVWARRDGVGVPGVVGVPALVASALSVLTALVPVDVAVLFSMVSAVTLVLVPSSVLPVSLLVVSACACCSAVS